MMKQTTFSVLIVARKNRPLQNGETPLFLRITINGKSAEISIKRSIDPTLWDVKSQTATKRTRECNDLNRYIGKTKNRIYDIYREFELENAEINLENIKNRYLGLDNKGVTLIQAYNEHNNDLAKLISKGVAANTLKRHKTSCQHVIEFLKFKYNKTDITFREINQKFILDYEVYLKSERNCNHNTTVKYIRNIGKIIRIGLSNGWLKTDPFSRLKMKTVEVDKPFLTADEMERIRTKKFASERIEQVKDTFLFCCFTGLAFVDVSSLTKKDIITGVDGELWIKKLRTKTGTLSMIPLLKSATDILTKYETHEICKKKSVLLPVISNQKMNAYLKEIADICKIEKDLTTHVARHTFATTVTLANNVSMEAVSKMLGHTTLQMTKKYARIVDSLVCNEMNKIKGIY